MDILISLILVITSQYTHISNYQVIYLKCVQSLFVHFTLWGGGKWRQAGHSLTPKVVCPAWEPSESHGGAWLSLGCGQRLPPVIRFQCERKMEGDRRRWRIWAYIELQL